jgi:hypothetical protein
VTIIEPNMPSHLYDTYGLISPKTTHTRVATCAEVDCEAMANGWVTKVDVGTEQGQARARYIVDHSGRAWTAEQDGGLVTFTFAAGQTCFAEHRVTLERDPFFTVKRGDYRTRGLPHVVGAQEWVDRFGTNQEHLKKTIEG